MSHMPDPVFLSLYHTRSVSLAVKLGSMCSHFGCFCGVVGHQECVLIAVLGPSRSF